MPFAHRRNRPLRLALFLTLGSVAFASPSVVSAQVPIITRVVPDASAPPLSGSNTDDRPTDIPVTRSEPGDSTDGSPPRDDESPDRNQRLRVRAGATWQVLSPAGVFDNNPTKLGIGIDYGRVLLSREHVMVSLIFPFWFQINTTNRDENVLFSSTIGIDFSTEISSHVWFYSIISAGLGGGIVKGHIHDSQVGIASQIGLGVKITSRIFDFGIEPLSLHLLNPFGPNAMGAIVSANVLGAISAKF